MNIKQLRKSLNLTQEEVSKIVNMPLRTYKNYENDKRKVNTIKFEYILNKLTEYGLVNEEKGILTIEKIKTIVYPIFQAYDIKFCYLFGSYAKGNANDKSDVDLLISSSITGLAFYGLVEKLRSTLNKRVDLLTLEQIKDNQKLINDILNEGIKIYGS
jgi:predicted nucleotidyltransferase/DNA-binding XRE family transcriptional regulator